MINETFLIMMATYNGQDYIKEQIESIQNQTIVNWQLVIRDDNSSDRTVEIIQEFSKQDSRINLIENTGDFHGAYYNFFGLLNEVRDSKQIFDFYLFSDQDDIWENNKLEKLYNFYADKEVDEPVLIYTDMKIVDGNDKEIYPSMQAISGISYTNPISAFLAHKVYGCTIFFNHQLFSILPLPSSDSSVLKYLAHDNFVAKVAALKGQVYFLSDRLIRYRRYGSNVTAKHEYNLSLKRIFKRLLGFSDLAKDHALTYKQTLMTNEILETQGVSESEQEFINKVRKIITRGGIYACYMIVAEGISWGTKGKTLSRAAVLLSGKYKKYLE